jgi:hypothetical protein
VCGLGYGGQMGGGALLVEEAQMHVKDKDLVATLSQQPGAPRLIAAVYARVNTPLGFTRWLGPPGNYLIARPAARAAAHRDSARTDMPLDAAVILGLGEDALHVWAADPMLSQVHDHLGSLALERIEAIHAEIGKSWWPLTITLAGEAVELQARGDVRIFVTAFEQQRPDVGEIT